LTVWISRALAEAKSCNAPGKDRAAADLDAEQAFAQLKAALETGDLDGMDAAFSALQFLPLTAKRRDLVSKLAGLVLASEFEEALRTLDAM
jgi:hypothetical protein